MSKKAKVLTLLVFITAFFCISFNITKTYAAPNDDKKANLGAYNELDKQFRDRINVLKGVFGSNSIDEVALAATVLYGETSFSAVGSRYTEGSDWEKDYKSSLEKLAKEQENNSDQDNNISKESGVSNEGLDLLTAAAIIMADSAGWGGSYNEDKFKEALAGDTFIANNPIANAGFCGFAGLFNFQSDENTDGTWYNRKRICDNGYVGGIYNITPETEPDDKIRKEKKEEIAKQIIDFIHYYKLLTGSDGENCVVTTTGDFANWKQYDPQWKSIPVGSSGDNIGSIGCLATSIAIEMARSGTTISNISGGFNPGTFVEALNKNNGFDDGGNFRWQGHESVASNWKYYDNSVPANVSSTSALAKKLSEELSTPAEGKYQKFIVLQTTSNKYSEHWVAVDSVTDSGVTIFDPAEQGNTLDDNYSSWTVKTYRVMYATDVEQGKTGSSSASNGNSCGGGDLLELVKEAIKNGEGFGTTCNYKGQGEGTGYDAHTDSADRVNVGWTTGYGFTQANMKSIADDVGYTTFIEDGNNGCTSKEYIDKMADLHFTIYIDNIKKLYSEKTGGKTLENRQYAALVYKNNHWPACIPRFIDDIANVDPNSYEIFATFMKYNGLEGSCGGYNGAELMYHLWYNGYSGGVRYYPCAQPTKEFWEKRVEEYKTEQVS